MQRNVFGKGPAGEGEVQLIGSDSLRLLNRRKGGRHRGMAVVG